MRILHVGIRNLDPGGVRTYVDLVSAGQRSRGHDPILCELWPTGHSTGVEYSLTSLVEFGRLARSVAPDVIHLHSQLPSYEEVGARSVLTAHEHSSFCPAGSKYLPRRRKECHLAYGNLKCLFHHFTDVCGSRNPLNIHRKFELTRHSGDFTGRWIAPSRYTERMIRSRGFDGSRIHLVPNPGFSPQHPGIRMDSASLEFVFVGRLVAEKGCDVAIRAMSLLPSGSTLNILGDGPVREELEALVRSLDLGSRIRFLGWQPRAQVDAHIDRCLAVLVPSLWPEPFGLVALEAYSHGKPVVASALGGLLDTVRDGSTGMSITPGDHRAFAEAMRRLVDSPADAAAMGENGRTDLHEKFSLRLHLDALESVYGLLRG